MTMQASSFYELVNEKASPVTLALAKSHMKVPASTTADDSYIQSLIETATEYGESYTGREFREKTWKLYVDYFVDRIVIQRNPVASISSVKHLVDDILITVSSSIYYLKKLTQCAEVLLKSDQEWPSDTDDIEHAIVVEFVTGPYTKAEDRIKTAILRHIAWMYSNRGDCALQDSAKKSGANVIYDQFRISRV